MKLERAAMHSPPDGFKNVGFNFSIYAKPSAPPPLSRIPEGFTSIHHSWHTLPLKIHAYTDIASTARLTPTDTTHVDALHMAKIIATTQFLSIYGIFI